MRDKLAGTKITSAYFSVLACKKKRGQFFLQHRLIIMTGETIITLRRIVTFLRTQSLELFQSLLVLRAEMSDMSVWVLLHVSVEYFMPSMRATCFGALAFLRSYLERFQASQIVVRHVGYLLEWYKGFNSKGLWVGEL